MSLCQYCEPWVARSQKQLRTRRANLLIGGEVHPCSRCGSRDWAVTVVGNEDDALPPQYSWLRRFGAPAIAILVFLILLGLMNDNGFFK